MKTSSAQVVVALTLALSVSSAPSFAQTSGCDPRELSAVLQPGDPVYADAIELGRALDDQGLGIRCLLRSKLEGMFEGMIGAALYRTGAGDFETLFLPASQTFDDLNIIERQNDDGFTYWFDGTPLAWPTNQIESSRRIYFLKHANQLFVVNDAGLSARLERVFAGGDR